MSYKKPILSGTLKNIPWRSLTSEYEMKNNVLEHVLNKHNAIRISMKIMPISMEVFTNPVYYPNIKEFIEGISPMDLYKIRAKYSNHKIVS